MNTWFLLGGLVGILLAVWLNKPHGALDRLDALDPTIEMHQHATDSGCNCFFYAIALIVVMLIVWMVVPFLLTSTMFTPERSEHFYRAFWNLP